MWNAVLYAGLGRSNASSGYMQTEAERYIFYSRSQAQKQLDATATMASAEGGALEALVPGWTQPAWRRA